MKEQVSRRQFLGQAVKAGGAALAAKYGMSSTGAFAGPDPRITIGLSQYSLRQLFHEGELHVLDYPRFAREEFGIQAIDVWEGGLPEDRLDDPELYRQLRGQADRNDSDIFLWMTGVVDATADTAEKRRRQVRDFFKPADRAARLECRYLRVFLRAPDQEPDEAAEICAETLEPLADYAAKRDLTVVIEPGASALSQKGSFLAGVVDRLDHPHCRLMPDFGKFSGDVYAGTRAMMPKAAVVSAKSHDFDEEGNEIHFDYGRLMQIIVEAGFEGIIAIEYEGSELPPVKGVEATRRLIRRSLDQV